MGKRRKVRSQVFHGVRYHVDVDLAYVGWCDNPHKRDNDNEYPAIRLPGGLPFGNEPGAKSGLQILLHECGHAQNYKKSEKVVDREAVELSDLLWRLGYRRTKK